MVLTYLRQMSGKVKIVCLSIYKTVTCNSSPLVSRIDEVSIYLISRELFFSLLLQDDGIRDTSTTSSQERQPP